MAIKFYLNNAVVRIRDVDPRLTVSEYLHSRGLFGTRVVDERGGAGADAVAVGAYNAETKNIEYYVIPAATTPLGAIDQLSLFTLEGIGNMEHLHPIQERLFKCDAFQCGYCAGGFTMVLYALLRDHADDLENITQGTLVEALDGNHCRCTGYRSKAAAIAVYASDIEETPANLSGYSGVQTTKFDKNLEPKFPEEFKKPFAPVENVFIEEDKFSGDEIRRSYYSRPIDVEGLYASLEKAKNFPGKQIIVSGSCSRPVNREFAASTIQIDHIKEFLDFSACGKEHKLEIGSSITITNLRKHLKALKMEDRTEVIKHFENRLAFTANTIVRNVATVGGMICKGHSNSDLAHVFVAMDAVAHVLNIETKETRHVPVADLVEKHLSTGLVEGRDFVTSFTLTLPEQLFVTKIGRRALDAYPVANNAVARYPDGAYRVVIGCLNDKIGGNGIKRVTEIEEYLNKAAKKTLSEDNIYEACVRITPIVSDNTKYINATETEQSRANGEYRRSLAASQLLLALFNVYLQQGCELSEHAKESGIPDILADEKEFTTFGMGNLTLPLTKRSWPESLNKYVGQYLNAKNQKSKCVGDIRFPIDYYADDTRENVTHASFVLTSVTHGHVVKVDTSEAEKIPGFICYVDANDIPNKVSGNMHSGIMTDTPVFVKDNVVLHRYQPIGLVTATSKAIAKLCASLVKVEYDADAYDDSKGIHDVKTAIERGSYLPNCGVNQRFLELGNLEEGFKAADYVIEGENYVFGQDHTYWEPQNCVVVPLEDGRYTIYSKTQNPSKVAFDVCMNLGIPNSDVNCYVMQIGGGFGGAQDRPSILATAASVAAYKTHKIVKFVLDRGEDMVVTGGRHPFFMKYKAGFTKEGKYTALDLLIVMDGGSTFDVTAPVLDKCIFQSQSCYTIPNFRVEGRAAMTNRVTNTAYRGFGAPQATIAQELILDHATAVLPGFERKQFEFRMKNLTRPGEKRIVGTYLTSNDNTYKTDFIYDMWTKALESSKFVDLRKQIDAFNDNHRLVKRGLAVIPIINACNFEDSFMAQGSAMVHIYRPTPQPDGTMSPSVCITHAGIEMGQGLNTKMAQVAAETLGIGLEHVRVIETDTHHLPNTQPTAASSGADVNGPAVKLCCEEILKNLQPIREKLGPDAKWEDIVNCAYFSRVPMTAQKVYSLPYFQWDWKKKIGHNGFYSSHGIGVAAVEINLLTGKQKNIYTYVLKDVGSPLNPNLDCGQIEGGYAQGLGLNTIEDLSWDSVNHDQVASNMDVYTIPSIADVPHEAETCILSDAPCDGNIFKSKASAESPLCLGVANHMALKDAIRAARREYGLPTYVKVGSPITYRECRTCVGDITKAILEHRAEN